jgi:hypothetical protein
MTPFTIDDTVLLIGGDTGYLSVFNLDVYNVTENSVLSFNLSGSLTFPPITTHGLVFMSVLDRQSKNLINVYNTASKSIFRLDTPFQQFRSRPCAVNDVVLFFSTDGNSNWNRTVDIFNVTSNTWRTTTSPTQYVSAENSAVIGNEVFIFCKNFCPSPSSEIVIYNTISDTWTTVDLHSPQLTVSDSLFLNELACFAYWNGSNLVVQTYNISSTQWDMQLFYIPNLFAVTRTTATNLVLGIEILVVEEGYLRNRRVIYDFEQFIFVNDTCQGFVAIGDYVFCPSLYTFQFYDQHLNFLSNATWKMIPETDYFSKAYLDQKALFSSGTNRYSLTATSDVYILDYATGNWSTTYLTRPTVYAQTVAIGNSVVLFAGDPVYYENGGGPGSDLVFAFTSCATAQDCDDGLYCNGQEFCDSIGFCASGPLPCTNTSFCIATCDENTDSCEYPQVSCDNGIFCDGTETCDSTGRCVSSGNPCYEETECHTGCVETTKQCTFSAYGTNCTGTAQCSIFVCDGRGACTAVAISGCSKDSNTSVIVGATVGPVLGSIILVAGIAYLCYRRRKGGVAMDTERNSLEMSLYEIDDIQKQEKLGSGEFGEVYRGTMDV